MHWLAPAHALSPEGFKCTAGEAIAASAAGYVPYDNGCHDAACTPHETGAAVSVGYFCYRSGQTRDSDANDRTMGCFCR